MRYLIALFALMGVLNLSACNTMEGLGKDVGKLGDKIESSAERHK